MVWPRVPRLVHSCWSGLLQAAGLGHINPFKVPRYLGSHGLADKHAYMYTARKQMGCEICSQIPRADSLWEDM